MPDLRFSLLAWEQWKTDVYALAKATLNTPHALAACETLTIVIVRRLQRGCAVRIDGEESLQPSRRQTTEFRTLPRVICSPRST